MILFNLFMGLCTRVCEIVINELYWEHFTSSKNRERFLRAGYLGIHQGLSAQVGLMWDKHFTADGNLIEAVVFMNSFHAKNNPPPSAGGASRNLEAEFHAEQPANQTHSRASNGGGVVSKREGEEAKISFMGDVLMHNGHRLIISPRLAMATGAVERKTAWELVSEIPGRPRVNADEKAYDLKICIIPACLAGDVVRGLKS